MNVTEKQKEIMLSYMCKYSDFGRGRLRYNSENKRKIDGLWEQLTTKLNMSACGPSKSAKEWSKTWRDWKSNTLKKVAKHKAYIMGTGGGSPKNLQLTAVENALLDFLTPDASGLTNVSEGGFENKISSNDPIKDQYSSNLSSVQENIKCKEKIFKEDLNQYSSSFSSVQEDRRLEEENRKCKERRFKEDLNQYSSSFSSVQEDRRLEEENRKCKERRFKEDLNQYSSSFSSVQEDRRLEDVNQYYSSSALPCVENASNIDKIYLTDSSDDSILRSHKSKECVSQSKRRQFPIMGKKQPKTKKPRTLVPFLNNDVLNDTLYKNKENIQDKDNQMTPLDSTKYQNTDAKFFKDVKKPNLMTTAIKLLDKKTCTSESIKLQLLQIKQEKLELKKKELDIQTDMLQQLQDMNTTLSSLRENICGQYLTADT